MAIDGTRVEANASKHKAMSYERMGEAEQRLRQEVEARPQGAAAVDEGGAYSAFPSSRTAARATSPADFDRRCRSARSVLLIN